MPVSDPIVPDPVVIVGSARTPIGAFQGDLKDLTAPQLAAAAIRASVERASLPSNAIDEVLFGCVLPAGLGQAPARQAAFGAGLSASTGAVTINKMCGSGMKAVMLAHDLLLAGSAKIAVAGGMERERGGGVNGAGAVADEQGEVHDLARLAALNNERDLGAFFFADQPIVHRGHGKKTGNRGVSSIDAAIGKDEQRITGVDGVRRAIAQVFERMPQAFFAILGAEERRKRRGEQIAGRDTAQFFQVAVGQDGMRQPERVAVLRRLIQNVALRADVTDQRHHQLFADGVDRRIGDLRPAA